MPYSSKDIDINTINSDNFNQADFSKWESDDLFEVMEYFWAFLQDAVKKGYMVYGHPIKTAPKTEFDVLIKTTGEVRKLLNFCSYNYLGYSIHTVQFVDSFAAPNKKWFIETSATAPTN
ncbi:MAG: hypothetical protein JXB26_09315 [Candidatus Aminicenantes bacterium]|nr:hypothetical protein [Candidatus Aminicenantes bacterium]